MGFVIKRQLTVPPCCCHEKMRYRGDEAAVRAIAMYEEEMKVGIKGKFKPFRVGSSGNVETP
jgi:hypothetical protein